MRTVYAPIKMEKNYYGTPGVKSLFTVILRWQRTHSGPFQEHIKGLILQPNLLIWNTALNDMCIEHDMYYDSIDLLAELKTLSFVKVNKRT